MFVNTTMDDEEGGAPAEPARRKAAATATLNISKKNATRLKRVSSILRKKRSSLTLDDRRLLEENAELVEEFYKRRERRAVWQSRKTEQEDTKEDLQAKCEQLAQAIHDAEFLVVYTGAGISTAASIPDYRGPNGIWTMLQKGLDVGHHDLSAAEPTLTHMALSALYQQGIVRHVVSQNCDGLHLRSGLPKTAMSEVHGNMYIEVCKHCVPAREYVRTFDVTERTSIYKHTTSRRCYRCGEPLIDTIVHFGERGKLRWPLNWQGACQAANACDTILCLGSSLKVLKKYTWLWQMDRPAKKRPQLYIVNLQWTPKDKDATLKINGKCDEVMALVMKALGYELPFYSRSSDPIFNLSTQLHPAEAATSSRPLLIPPPEDDEALDVVENKDPVVTGHDVRWSGKVDRNGKHSEEVKEENLENEVKDEKCDIKSETKHDIKPVNGVHSALNFALHTQSFENANSDSKDECKPILDESNSLIKSEGELINDVKDEMDIKEEKTWNNGESFPGHYSELYRALTVKSKSNEGHEALESSVDMEEMKSEPSDSDEDFQTSDAEGDPWLSDKLEENTLDEESSCTDSDSSEQMDDCQTEDSEMNISDPHPLKPNNIDYFKLAYASTNVQMAKQGQAILKQNDFYGTGLCIRSFVDNSKTSDRNYKPASNRGVKSSTIVTASENTPQNAVAGVEAPTSKLTSVKSTCSKHKQSVCHSERDGSDTSSCVQDGSDTSSHVRDGSDTSSCVRDGWDASSRAWDGSDTLSHVQDGRSTASQLRDGSDTSSHLWDGSDISSHLRDGSDISSRVQDGNDTSSRVRDGSDTSSCVQVGRDASSRVWDGNATSSCVQDGSDTSSHVRDGSDTSSHVRDGSDTSSCERDGSDTSSLATTTVLSELSSLPNHCKSPTAMSVCTRNCNKMLSVCSSEYENILTSCSGNCKQKCVCCNNHESDAAAVSLSYSRLKTSNHVLKKTHDSKISLRMPLFSSKIQVNDINEAETAPQKCDVPIQNTVDCQGDRSLTRRNSASSDGSFMLRTHIVDGIIRTACVETLTDDKPEDENVLVPSIGITHKVSLPKDNITRITLPSHIGTKSLSIPLCNNSSLCQENFVSKTQVSAIAQHSNFKNVDSKFVPQLRVSESDELKSIWQQSFCGSSNEKNLSTLAMMMGMKECRLIKCENRDPNNIKPRGDEIVQSPEKSSSVILKNICTEALNDSVARQKGSAKRKLKGCDNEDVKCIWFWGFDSNVENKEKEFNESPGNMISGDESPIMNGLGEVSMDTDGNECLPVGRVTRSRTRASSDSRVAPEVDVFKCHCNGSNPELCKTARLRASRAVCDADVEKAREIIRRRRTYNYRKYEPVFEKKLKSFTYERIRVKRKSKFESVHSNDLENVDEEEYYEQENEAKEDEQKVSDSEECREKDEKGEKKITPGWYGKGLRKGMKKKTRV
ncbi:uncharacterized protein Sirt7 [Procambarus clarkii]|uniref:uncharacterized protein Sirt7 n=1 Tax=Procambarus clarkii TaxID=6728 RepID=UPI003742F1A4